MASPTLGVARECQTLNIKNRPVSTTALSYPQLTFTYLTLKFYSNNK